mmetsp:Transcript_8635/g.23707  ORF Transcript_8635/g.23707 Transcript_8635/m.23707 type:complete len:288 (+) Transcript_8635:56-919(+)
MRVLSTRPGGRRRLAGAMAAQQLPLDVWERTFAFVDALSLLQCALVSRAWRIMARDGKLWAALCDELWRTKLYVPKLFRSAREPGVQTYFRSLEDARRDCITAEEMCELTWSFRFKANAGSVWTYNDPYWSGEPARHVSFGPDGSITRDGQYLDGWRWDFCEVPVEGGSNFVPLAHACGGRGPARGCGVSVTHHVFGTFPAQLVHRHSSWGFILNSTWVVYSSVPMLKATAREEGLCDASLRGLEQPWQWAQATEYNHTQIDEADEVGIGDDSDVGGPAGALPQQHA